MMRFAPVVAVIGLAGCDLPPPTPEQAAQRCEERARGAQGPEFGLTVGAGSNTGPFARGNIRVTGDLLRGRDPLEVYESCVIDLTGEPPIRPPRLRKI